MYVKKNLHEEGALKTEKHLRKYISRLNGVKEISFNLKIMIIKKYFTLIIKM